MATMTSTTPREFIPDGRASTDSTGTRSGASRAGSTAPQPLMTMPQMNEPNTASSPMAWVPGSAAGPSRRAAPQADATR